jgi:hypothetical protein
LPQHPANAFQHIQKKKQSATASGGSSTAGNSNRKATSAEDFIRGGKKSK